MPIEQQERGDIPANGRAFESRASRLGGPGRKRTRPSNRYRKDSEQSALLRTSSQAVHGGPDRVRHPACPQSPHLPGSKTAGFAGSHGGWPVPPVSLRESRHFTSNANPVVRVQIVNGSEDRQQRTDEGSQDMATAARSCPSLLSPPPSADPPLAPGQLQSLFQSGVAAHRRRHQEAIALG